MKATSVLAGFHASPLSWSNWNLEIFVFVEEGKPENLKKKPSSKARSNNKLNPCHGTSWLELNLRHTDHERRALSPLRHPCSILST